MNNYIRLLLIILTVIVLICEVCISQPQPVKKNERFSDEVNIFIEVPSFPIPSSDSDKVDIGYRIPKNFFVLIKERENLFRAKCEIIIEIFDSSNVFVNRRIFTYEFVNSTPFFEPNTYSTGRLPFHLLRGKYKIVFMVNDVLSNRKYKTEVFSSGSTLSDDSKFIFSDIIFLFPFDWNDFESRSISPINLGGNILFGQPFYAYFEIVNKSVLYDSLPFYFTLRKIENDKTFSIIVDSSKEYQFVKFLSLDAETGTYYINPKQPETKLGVILFLPDLKLKVGDYELIVNIPNNSYKVMNHFKVIWLDMPKSLKNIDLAIEMLDYIATKDELKNFQTINSTQRENNFFTFWEKKDPTPETAYNELMAEYYYRVDYAIENFMTIDNRLGAKTDRGKIHILYGKPEKIERVLLPTLPSREIWLYPRINKKFIFEDIKKNDYKLVGIENL